MPTLIYDIMRVMLIRVGLSPDEATRRFYPLNSQGLMTDESPRLLDFQQPYARPASEVAHWAASPPAVSDWPRSSPESTPPS